MKVESLKAPWWKTSTKKLNNNVEKNHKKTSCQHQTLITNQNMWATKYRKLDETSNKIVKCNAMNWWNDWK
jgi:hypothetical protein